MSVEPTGNLVLVLGAFFRAMATEDGEPVRRLLSPDIVWESPYPGIMCSGPDTVMEFLNRGLLRNRRITRIEASESGDTVTATAHGPDFMEIRPDGESVPRESAGLVFTVRDGLITHMKGI